MRLIGWLIFRQADGVEQTIFGAEKQHVQMSGRERERDRHLACGEAVSSTQLEHKC